jgi:hypothetical protein
MLKNYLRRNNIVKGADIQMNIKMTSVIDCNYSLKHFA